MFFSVELVVVPGRRLWHGQCFSLWSWLLYQASSYGTRNQGVSTRESISAWLAIARRAKSNGKIANVMISSAFGCPFEGEVPMDRIIEIAKQLVDAEPVELAIADSIGVAVPNQITELVGRLQSEVGPIPLRFHLHNTRNTGLANAQAAIDAGG